MAGKEMTIGELARRAKVATSMLRFYERSGLLQAGRRLANGYRVYPADAERSLLFIHRAQRLGFSLADIKQFLSARTAEPARGTSVAGIAERRFLDIERRLTELLVLRHELELFLDDLTKQAGHRGGILASRFYRDLVDHICGHTDTPARRTSIDRLIARVGCSLARVERTQVFAALRGKHVHVWRDGDGYTILVPGHDPNVVTALHKLAAEEADCHTHIEPRLTEDSEGWLFSAQGPNSFLFAQLFLALEAADA
jgi:DNA-binding transcriptional MerR regulator